VICISALILTHKPSVVSSEFAQAPADFVGSGLQIRHK
jgi:hypothetical protein